MIEFSVYFSFIVYTQNKNNRKKNKICCIVKINAAK